MTSRRAFLGALAASAAFALDPERALWVPGAKTISIPRPPAEEFRCLLYNPAFKLPDGRDLFNPPISYEEFHRCYIAPYLQFHRDAFVLSFPPA